MSKISSEEAVSNIIFHTFRDISYIKTLEESIERLSNSIERPINPGQRKVSKILSKLHLDEDYLNSPERISSMEKFRQGYEEELKKLRTVGSNDGLQPIILLLGNTSKIQQNVIKQIEENVHDKEVYGYDVEFRSISSSQLTKEFVSSLPRPKGNDGGVLIISNFSAFTESFSPTEQIGLLRGIMTKQGYTSYGVGPVCTGWRIIFLEDTDDENKWWPDSCIIYFGNKGCLYSYFVE